MAEPFRWLIVHAADDSEVFLAEVRDRLVATLRARQSEVGVIDLYADGFDPSMSADEHVRYFDVGADHPDPLVAGYIAELRRAQGVIFVFPTLWPALPAVLKGWFDRVLLPDVAFTLHPTTQRVTPALRHVRRLVGVTSSTTPTWQVRLDGDGARTTIGRALRLVCSRRTRVSWFALDRRQEADEATRQAFTARVCSTLAGMR